MSLPVTLLHENTSSKLSGVIMALAVTVLHENDASALSGVVIAFGPPYGMKTAEQNTLQRA